MSARFNLLRRSFWVVPILFGLATAQAASFKSEWDNYERPWVGPNYWAGPLQDWRLANDRLECFVSGGNRLVFLMTLEATAKGEGCQMSVRLGRLAPDAAKTPESGWAGFRFGIKGPLPDYRSAALHGKGIDAGLRTDGTLFVAGKSSATKVEASGEVLLKLRMEGNSVTFSATDVAGATASVTESLNPDAATGHFALVCHRQAPPGEKTGPRRPTSADTNRGGDVRFWFDDWTVSGDRIAEHPQRAWGPILWTQYSLSKGVMKMNVQVAPLGKNEPNEVVLRHGDQLRRATVDSLARTATFRVANWNAAEDTPYSVHLAGLPRTRWEGTVRRNPVEQTTIVVAGFTGNEDYIFPNSALVGNVAKHNPDVLFFSGDQIYEGVAGYGIQRTWEVPVETAVLDYLRKWYLVGWAWKDLLKDRPSLFFPDDHDVYQGNIWGAGGRRSEKRDGFDDGGYGMDAVWVNAVQRTQTAHLPDPCDPTPIQQGIGVYYGDMNYGRISFAMIEDRKFKSGPATVLPRRPGRSDHVRPEDVDRNSWDPREIDAPEAVLLGDRQLKFLDAWAADWADSDFKVVLSQTIFCNLANYHGPAKQYLIADLDANGWPQTGRNKALAAMRRGFAFHLAGDQHLPSIVHHGIDTWNDAGFSFCVPSIAAGYPRSWLPDREGRPVQNRKDPGLPNTGEYRDGLGNHVTVHAIGNPEATIRTHTPELRGHDKASGYGLVKFNKQTREITLECWRLLADVAHPKPGDQFPGWPLTIKLEDNYGRTAVAHLPALRISGMDRSVIQVIDESSGEMVYTLRIGGREFRPKVFSHGPHTVIVGEPGRGRVKRLEGLTAAKADECIEVNWEQPSR